MAAIGIEEAQAPGTSQIDGERGTPRAPRRRCRTQVDCRSASMRHRARTKTRDRLVRVGRPTNLIVTEDVELAYEGVPPPMPLIIGFT